MFLSASGRKKAIEVFERRKADVWKHTAVGYSLSYARMIDLEVRLLEKEWCGEACLQPSGFGDGGCREALADHQLRCAGPEAVAASLQGSSRVWAPDSVLRFPLSAR